MVAQGDFGEVDFDLGGVVETVGEDVVRATWAMISAISERPAARTAWKSGVSEAALGCDELTSDLEGRGVFRVGGSGFAGAGDFGVGKAGHFTDGSVGGEAILAGIKEGEETGSRKIGGGGEGVKNVKECNGKDDGWRNHDASRETDVPVKGAQAKAYATGYWYSASMRRVPVSSKATSKALAFLTMISPNCFSWARATAWSLTISRTARNATIMA